MPGLELKRELKLSSPGVLPPTPPPQRRYPGDPFALLGTTLRRVECYNVRTEMGESGAEKIVRSSCVVRLAVDGKENVFWRERKRKEWPPSASVTTPQFPRPQRRGLFLPSRSERGEARKEKLRARNRGQPRTRAHLDASPPRRSRDERLERGRGAAGRSTEGGEEERDGGATKTNLREKSNKWHFFLPKEKPREGRERERRTLQPLRFPRGRLQSPAAPPVCRTPTARRLTSSRVSRLWRVHRVRPPPLPARGTHSAL